MSSSASVEAGGGWKLELSTILLLHSQTELAVPIAQPRRLLTEHPKARGSLLQGSTQAPALMKVASGGERWLQRIAEEVQLLLRGKDVFGKFQLQVVDRPSAGTVEATSAYVRASSLLLTSTIIRLIAMQPISVLQMDVLMFPRCVQEAVGLAGVLVVMGDFTGWVWFEGMVDQSAPMLTVEELERRMFSDPPTPGFKIGDVVMLIRPPSDKLMSGAVAPYVVVTKEDTGTYYSVAILGPDGQPEGLPTRAAGAQLRPFDMSRTTPRAE